MRLACLLFGVGILCACNDVPNFPPIERDGGMQCGPGGEGMDPVPCPTGEVCLGGRCYAECEDDAQCANSQVCEDGVCVDGEKPDAGTPVEDAGTDSGPPDPCDTIMCDEMPGTPVCHPSGTCVQCTTVEHCSPAERICDLAFGTCGTFMAGRTCAPCSDSSDCEGATEVCTERPAQRERVCLAPCTDGTCPRGFSCNAMDFCEPRIGTCTNIRSMVENKPCLEDTQCAPLGTTIRENTCQGEDPGTGAMGQCRHPCGDDNHCVGGYTCDGMFCQPLPAM